MIECLKHYKKGYQSKKVLRDQQNFSKQNCLRSEMELFYIYKYTSFVLHNMQRDKCPSSVILMDLSEIIKTN
jgi:hypothetical protein